MKNVMKFKGYTAHIDYNDDERLFPGHIAGIDDTVGFHADAVEGLRHAFREAVDDRLEACSRIGKTPGKPIPGRSYFASVRTCTAGWHQRPHRRARA